MTSWTRVALCLAATALAGIAAGQGGGGMSFDNVDIDAGIVKINFATGRIDRIGAGAALVIHAADPGQEPLRIRAGEITMSYASDDAADPAQVVFDGDVRINHPVGTITAGRADWDFGRNVIVFTKGPTITSDRFKKAQAEKITLDLTNSTMTLEGNTEVQGAQLTGGEGAGGGSSDPSLLAAGDIRDWPGLVSQLKSGAAAEGATPAKQVIGTLDAQSKNLFQSATNDMLLQNKDQIIKMLNNALKSPKLYSADAWAGIDVDADTKALLAEGASGEKLTKANRALLHAAFPAEIAE